MIRAALHYAHCFGWSVFPLAPRDKVPLIPKWRDGRGVLDATTDADRIRGWWSRNPRAKIGIATGTVSGSWVLDVDPRNGGDDSLAELESAHGPLPETTEAVTGGGGRHVLFKCTEPIRCTVLAPGLDVKGCGGYIVAPPSIHPSGRRYCWEASCRPDETTIADAPEWLARMLDRRAPSPRYTHTDAVDPDSFLLGAAFRAAGWLGPQIRPGVWAARCPNEAAHSCGETFDSSSVLFAPKPGQRRGYFFCSHEHCRGTIV